MEPDELKAAWQDLDRRLARQDQIQFTLLRETRLEKARRNLRPLFWGQSLQALLGIALVVLGVACWTRNTGVPGLLATGIILHAFGVVTAVAAFITMALVGTIDYSAPVVAIQKKLALLVRFFTINSSVCGSPWWIMWVLVVVAFSGLGGAPAQTGTPLWIQISLAIGVAGLLGTWTWLWWRHRHPAPPRPAGEEACVADGADGIRRSQRILGEIAEFERQ